MRNCRLQLFSYLALIAHASTVVRNATYDDLKEGLTDTPLPTYKNLVCNSIVLPGNSTSVIAVGGIASASPPNRVLTSADQRVKNGIVSFAVAPPYKSLGLLDFYFGCTVRTGEEAVALASQYNITVEGFLRGSNQAVASKSSTFVPPIKPVTPVPMMHAELPKTFLQPLYNVTLTPDSLLVAVLVDNVHYYLST